MTPASMPAVGWSWHAPTGDQVRACRWTNLLGEIEYFSGNVDTAAALGAPGAR